MSISKSKFVSGVQCSKKFYFDIFRRDLKPPISEAQQALFTSGHQVGALAQSVFSRGRDASPDDYSMLSHSIKKTADWIAVGIQTIYEATFSASGAFCMLDILHHQDGERWAIEVKNSTGVKDYHLIDGALQYWVMEKSNCKPDKFFLMHINNQYVKNGAIEPEKLFHLEDITEQVVALQGMVDEKLAELINIKIHGKEPVVEIGPHCSSPFDCDYRAHCWKHIPEKSVFKLRGRSNAWEWYRKGIVKMADIPKIEKLSKRQELQVREACYIQPEPIKEFLSTWEYPLYFFDFETIYSVIPFLDGTRPYQQIPFQYSLHVVKEAGAKAEHFDFLANADDFREDSSSDPSLHLLQQMQNDIGSKGTLVAYNMGFEKMVLKTLRKLHPEYAPFINSLLERLQDLIVPFRKAWYYAPEMNGSASIKAVLPAIIPELKHSDLDISGGGQASSTFVQMIENENHNSPEIRQQLLDYCELDTLAMVKIWKELKRL